MPLIGQYASQKTADVFRINDEEVLIIRRSLTACAIIL